MSNYEDCFSFCVENGQRLLELKIVCSQRSPAICAQVYQMGNNDYRIYWNVGLTSIDYFHKIVDYYSPRMGDALHKMKINKAVTMAEHDNGFIRYVKQFTPVNEKVLKEHDMSLINAVINADWGSSFVDRIIGLDGHRYYLKIDGRVPREYEVSPIIPPNMSEIFPLIKFIVDDVVQIKETDRTFYMPSGTVQSSITQEDLQSLDIPPWMNNDD